MKTKFNDSTISTLSNDGRGFQLSEMDCATNNKQLIDLKSLKLYLQDGEIMQSYKAVKIMGIVA